MDNLLQGTLQSTFGERLLQNQPLARYTASRIGGPADGLLVASSVSELLDFICELWRLDAPFIILGGGSNVLVSDAGVRGVVVINRAQRVRIEAIQAPPKVWAESGANLGLVARKVAGRGLAGLEWAAGIPGTIGGAVVGNAGAHGGDMAGSLLVAEILHRIPGKEMSCPENMVEQWPVERLGYSYRSSSLKRSQGKDVVLAAWLRLDHSSSGEVMAKLETFNERRRRTQPPGASMGSMFKNPPGDYAGRLIEAVGLKGLSIGDAEISTMHANFFINHANATAAQVHTLIELARNKVIEKFGIELELEIELVGEW